MRALIVYESMFGTTETIANEIAKGMPPDVSAEVVNVDDAPDELDGVDLLVVGGPTHVHGMSRPSTRKGAADQTTGALRSERGIREWLTALEPAPAGLAAAVFDTRIDKPRWLTGSAARGAAKMLKQHHIRVIAPPESFYVSTGSPPAAAEGEPARARDWGHAIAAELTAKA